MSGDDELRRLLRAAEAYAEAVEARVLEARRQREAAQERFALLKSYQNSHVTFLHAIYLTMN
ncbi:hypothetical protein E4U59_004241 [Claviceps monticola]|nr:hypothetical protein E4U59_004241 [Claviceps monticola]